MLKYLINAISRATGFTKTESRGTLVLIFVISISLLFLSWGIERYKHGSLSSLVTTDSTALKWMDEVQASIDLKKETKSEFDKSVYLPTKKSYERKSDGKSSKSYTSHEKKEEEKKIEIKDINTATAEELRVVRGIGPAYSERIVKYRNLLGGFADTTQFKEVYGLKPETIQELVKHFQIQSEVRSVEINSDSLKVLAKHPYINYDLARVIINYRHQHGDFNSPDELRKIKAIDERTFLRLKPYLE